MTQRGPVFGQGLFYWAVLNAEYKLRSQATCQLTGQAVLAAAAGFVDLASAVAAALWRHPDVGAAHR